MWSFNLGINDSYLEAMHNCKYKTRYVSLLGNIIMFVETCMIYSSNEYSGVWICKFINDIFCMPNISFLDRFDD